MDHQYSKLCHFSDVYVLAVLKDLAGLNCVNMLAQISARTWAGGASKLKIRPREQRKSKKCT